MHPRSVLMLGLPSTGKSSFLAAFWHGISNAYDDVSMHLRKLPETSEYLDRIEDLWLRLNPLNRNLVGDSKEHHLDLRSGETHFSVDVPDLSGEVFKQYVQTRAVDKEFVERLKRATGVMLFVNPDTMLPGRRIEDADIVASAIESEDHCSNEAEQESDPLYDIETLPTSVSAVELLQIVSSVLGSASLRVSLVVSAWDQLEKLDLSPENWIRQNLPLLSQFVESNCETIETRIFGVSAQGGDYLSDQSRLLESESSIKRVKVVEGGNVDSDITRPIRWIIEAGW